MANETLPYNDTIANLTRIRLDDISSTIYGVIEGRLMIRPRGHDEWGTVCNEVSLISFGDFFLQSLES